MREPLPADQPGTEPNLFTQTTPGWQQESQAAQDAAARSAELSRRFYDERWAAEQAEQAELAQPGIFGEKEQAWLQAQPAMEGVRRQRLREISRLAPEAALQEGEDPELALGPDGAKLCWDFLAFMQGYNYPGTIPIHGVHSIRPDRIAALGWLLSSTY